MFIDDPCPSPSLSPKLERSPPRAVQRRRLNPSRYPVITDFFSHGPSDKKKRSRKRGIVPSEKASRPKRTSERTRASGNAFSSHLPVFQYSSDCDHLLDPHSANRRNSEARTRRQQERSHRRADLSVFTVAGGRIMSGWQRRNAVTIDTEDIAFRRALEPSARRPPQSPPHPLLSSQLAHTTRLRR